MYEAIRTNGLNGMVPWRAPEWFRASKTEDWDESPQALYHELPLDSTKREIRVLDLLPGRSGDTLRAELRVISLDGKPAPSYEPLSYT